jgi:catechol 2,3-dioxygenase-like lactoylglutathione lyase family enzyme
VSQAVRPAEGLFADPREINELGDLFANVWQLGYVSTDLDRATELLRDRFGLERVMEVPTEGATFLVGDEPAEWRTRIAMGARGGLIVEVIEPVGGEVGFYRRALPEDGSFALRLHHLATFVEPGDDVWATIEGLLERAGLRFDYTVLIPDRVRAGYVDTTAELGHWLEICQLQRADTEFFGALAADSA